MAMFSLGKTRKLGSLASVAFNQPPPISVLLPHMFQVNTEQKLPVEEFIPGAGTPVSIQGYLPHQGKDHVFDIRRVSSVEGQTNVEPSYLDRCESGEIHNSGYLALFTSNENDYYQPASNVSLYGVMQTNVPTPYSCSPAHFNMPGGNYILDHKYTSNILQINHPSRELSHGSVKLPWSRSYRCYSTISGAKKQDTAEIIPDCIKPDEKEMYIQWSSNNYKYCLEYQDELQEIMNGNSTLHEAIVHQNIRLATIAREYEMLKSSDLSNFEGVQGPFEPPKVAQPLQGLEPQGVQGLDCEHFKVWLDNCTKYRFLNCNEQLQELREGRKTLGQIFEEQEQVIRQVADDYKTGKITPTESGNTPTQAVKLTQRERLKRAVAQYGSTVIVFHIGISLISLGSFYLAVSSGVDLIGVLRSLGLGQGVLESRLAAGTTTFVAAYAVHKVFAPVRIAITLSCTPLIVRHLRRIGVLRQPPPATTTAAPSASTGPIQNAIKDKKL